MKIIVAGASHGGLVAAAKLSRAGFDVSVFERSQRDALSWDWVDDFDPSVFSRIGLEEPDSKEFSVKRDWTLVSPGGKAILPISLKEEERLISMNRRLLAGKLMEEAEKSGTDIHFETNIESPIIKESGVAGIKTSMGDLEADLVIDSAGIDSCIRKSLPGSYGVDDAIHRGQIFYAYRGQIALGDEDDGPPCVYLKHKNRRGLSWVLPQGNTARILIGSIDPMTEEETEDAVKDLIRLHGWGRDSALQWGTMVRIPLRRPLGRIVADGYALVGDAAFMTIPILGSGIESALLAGNILADVVLMCSRGKEGFPAEKLWPYQVQFFKEMGANLAGLDILKCYLLTLENDEMDFLLENGIFSPRDLGRLSTGRTWGLQFSDEIKRIIKGAMRPGLMYDLWRIMESVRKVKGRCRKIPPRYNPDKIERWVRGYEGACSGLEKKLSSVT